MKYIIEDIHVQDAYYDNKELIGAEFECSLVDVHKEEDGYVSVTGTISAASEINSAWDASEHFLFYKVKLKELE